ncbi:hypothetical protein RSAG8_07807, partial [Rhizoctonia solani AG-8 WAC10335]
MPILAKLANAGVGDTPNVDTLTEHLGQLEVEDRKADGAISESGSDPSDDSQSNSDSNGNTAPDRRELLRPQSPISKGGPSEIDWELAQILLHQRSFFLNYNGHNRNFEMYCWGIAFVPTPTGDVNVESQFWHVNATHEGFRFQLRYRMSHSNFTNDTASVMGYHLVLPSQSGNRALYKFPEFTLVSLHDDIMVLYRQLRTINGINYTTPTRHNISLLPTAAPVVNPNSGIHPALLIQPSVEHGRFSMQPEPNSNQGHLSSGLVGDEVASIPEQYYQAPITPGPSTLTEVGSMVYNEVEMRMDLENTTPTKDNIYAFATTFRKEGPGKGAHVIICLHCPPGSERRRITTDLRPWNLTRHMLIDFGIKDFHCNECNPPHDFTFKDQLERHVAKCHHTGLN